MTNPRVKQLIKPNLLKIALILVGYLLAVVIPLAAQDFTQGYSTDETLLRGSVVGLNKEDNNKVETITSDRSADSFGVAVRSNDSAVTLTNDRTGVFIATTGRFEVLISDINGDINPGDYLAVSSIRGIAMKSDSQQSHVLGKALTASNLGDANNVLSQATVVDDSGNEIEVAVGRVLADILIQENPDAANTGRAPQFLINISSQIAGKPVSALRIYAAIAIILVASAIAGSLLYSAVKSSIISIGRNPLSKRSVLAGLAQVVIISVIIFMSGLFAVYLILKI